VKKRVVILGSTGSIGVNSIDVIEKNNRDFQIIGLSARKNVKLLAEQARKIKPRYVCVADENKIGEFIDYYGNDKNYLLFSGESGLKELIEECDADLIINGLVGAVGLIPTLKALEKKIPVALANKETMVIGGKIVSELSKKNNTQIFPVDSEHSAIWQCLIGESIDDVKQIILTASGGPFLEKDKSELQNVTVEEALNHPNWKMGNKITIDSATMMNKGFEVIEAHWLFGISQKKIKILIHSQSIIHSMVEFIDGSIKAQLGFPDMRIPIQFALTYPRRIDADWSKLDFNKISTLTFSSPDEEKFPSISLAYKSLEMGGTAPAVLNAANETAVNLFLNRRIRFTDISEVVKRAINEHNLVKEPTLENLLEADKWTRNYVNNIFVEK
jgi:1-deoxy-D-xylulose-5-phosphate reductoisomerase